MKLSAGIATLGDLCPTLATVATSMVSTPCQDTSQEKSAPAIPRRPTITREGHPTVGLGGMKWGSVRSVSSRPQVLWWFEPDDAGLLRYLKADRSEVRRVRHLMPLAPVRPESVSYEEGAR